jgi:hypothetical protein
LTEIPDIIANAGFSSGEMAEWLKALVLEVLDELTNPVNTGVPLMFDISEGNLMAPISGRASLIREQAHVNRLLNEWRHDAYFRKCRIKTDDVSGKMPTAISPRYLHPTMPISRCPVYIKSGSLLRAEREVETFCWASASTSVESFQLLS